jgi:predicted nucleic acid-binding Zn ribbon protein
MTSYKQGNDHHRPVGISQLLSSVFTQKKWRSKLELHRVFEFWDSIVGRDIAAVAQPSLVRGRVLWVKVADPIWMQQLHLQKILLLNNINKQLHGETFSDIHFQLNSSLAAPPDTEKIKSEPPPAVIDKKQEQEFDRLISSLDGDDLKSSLKSLWLKMHTKRE